MFQLARWKRGPFRKIATGYRTIKSHIFFDQSEEIVAYLIVKCPQHYYKNIPAQSVAEHCMESNISMEISGCMKQHLIVFTTNWIGTCREHFCTFVAFLHSKFDECFNEQDKTDDL